MRTSEFAPALSATVSRAALVSFSGRLAAVAALIALGDFLFYRSGPGPGIALVFFIGALACTALAVSQARPAQQLLVAVVLFATLAPLIEDANALSLLIASCGAATTVLISLGGWEGSFPYRLLAAVRLLIRGPFQVLIDLPETGANISAGSVQLSGRNLAIWILPICMSAVFAGLFAAANPIIEGWLKAIDFTWLLALFDVGRTWFWLAMLVIAWPFAFARRLKSRSPASANVSAAAPAAEFGDGSVLFGERAILRCLLAFNALFAVQTTLDVAILWQGHSLPAGVSFADYAHRGAYPLIVTALLAGAFVIAAMQPGQAAGRSSLIRALVILWTAQNIALVISSLLRLKLYVEVYSLTYWRVAAFIWMALVAVGLVLISIQVWRRLSNGWLISAITMLGAATLYACAFVNFAYIIADTNLRQCKQGPGSCLEVDRDYIRGLGPDVIPAIDRQVNSRLGPDEAFRLSGIRNDLADVVRHWQTDWRSWTFRGWRLARYLEAHPVAPSLP